MINSAATDQQGPWTRPDGIIPSKAGPQGPSGPAYTGDCGGVLEETQEVS